MELTKGRSHHVKLLRAKVPGSVYHYGSKIKRSTVSQGITSNSKFDFHIKQPQTFVDSQVAD